MPFISYDECLRRLRAQVAANRPIIGAGAGTGISAKCAEMGGIDLAARIKELEPRTAVLFMSGYNERPLAAGAPAALIEKPFTPAALLERVREALGHRSTSQ